MKNNLKKMGLSGVLFFIGVVVLIITAAQALLIDVGRVGPPFVGGLAVSIVLIVLGLILTPGKKNVLSESEHIEQQQGYVNRQCEKCGCGLSYDVVTQTYGTCPVCAHFKQCRDCGTMLIHNEANNTYDCTYCQISFPPA
jgi:hypothetical protein